MNVVDQPIRYVVLYRTETVPWTRVSSEHATAAEARDALADHLAHMADTWKNNNSAGLPWRDVVDAEEAVRHGFADRLKVAHLEFAVAKQTTVLVLPQRIEDLEV